MPALQQLTGIINATLRADQFQGMKFKHSNWNTIADYQKDTGDDSMFVSIIDNKGNITDISLNDIYYMQVFHLIEKLDYMIDPDYGDYGTPGDVMRETASMKMILYGDKGKLNIRQEEIAAMAMMDIPKELLPAQINPFNLNSVRIEVGNVDTDSYKIFPTLWTKTEYKLKPNDFIISISYNIVSTFNKSCYNIC